MGKNIKNPLKHNNETHDIYPEYNEGIEFLLSHISADKEKKGGKALKRKVKKYLKYIVTAACVTTAAIVVWNLSVKCSLVYVDTDSAVVSVDVSKLTDSSEEVFVNYTVGSANGAEKIGDGRISEGLSRIYLSNLKSLTRYYVTFYDSEKGERLGSFSFTTLGDLPLWIRSIGLEIPEIPKVVPPEDEEEKRPFQKTYKEAQISFGVAVTENTRNLTLTARAIPNDAVITSAGIHHFYPSEMTDFLPISAGEIISGYTKSLSDEATGPHSFTLVVDYTLNGVHRRYESTKYANVALLKPIFDDQGLYAGIFESYIDLKDAFVNNLLTNDEASVTDGDIDITFRIDGVVHPLSVGDSVILEDGDLDGIPESVALRYDLSAYMTGTYTLEITATCYVGAQRVQSVDTKIIDFGVLR